MAVVGQSSVPLYAYDRLPGLPPVTVLKVPIETTFSRPVFLVDVARELGLSAGHLTTVVRRKTGRTVQQWITERRMAEARRLLAGSDLTVAAVAGQVGYTDAGYFTRRFRRSHGTTPLEWRRGGR